MSLAKIRLLLLSLFFICISIVFSVSSINKNNLINKELRIAQNKIETSYKVATKTYQQSAQAMHQYISQTPYIKHVASRLNSANETQKDFYRKELKELLDPLYPSLKILGVLQLHFFLPDNSSYLRMHKPNKFGDDLTHIRYSVKTVNETQEKISGFEQGRVAHAYRNVFPLFDESGKYLMPYEISFSSESMQRKLMQTSGIYSHFLINKSVFDAKTWAKKELVIKYVPSIENKDYMFSPLNKEQEVNSKDFEKFFTLKNEKLITKNMAESKTFSIQEAHQGKIKLISFYPIRNIKNNITVAYYVSYSDSPYIETVLKNFLSINTISLLLFISLFFFIYREVLSKRKLQTQTQEQKELLSLFDEGAITLFKWKNDAQWSVEYVSKNVTLLTGYSVNEFLSSKKVFSSLINKEHLKKIQGEVTHAIENNIHFFTHQAYKITTKENDEKWLHDNTSIIKDEHGNITHFLGYIIDITNLKNLELEVLALNKTLHDDVKRKTDENITKDKLLQEQSKLAAMGEMVGNIAHQWRQPLNSLSINIQNLDDDFEDGLITADFIDTFIKKQASTISFMSQTIDDFRSFFRVDKIKKEFSVLETIQSTLSIISTQIKMYDIDIQLKGDDFKITQIQSEFAQVVLNIITNAKDAIVENNIKNPRITIEIISQNNQITICDNAGGIPQAIQDRIFEPYFTTKETGKGTGIGLYMSKLIIEQHMKGELYINDTCSTQNCPGAFFTIILPA